MTTLINNLLKSQQIVSRRCLHVTRVVANTNTEESPLLASVNSPFIFTEFDVNYHRQALGHPPHPILNNDMFSPPQPHPLFGLLPAEFSVMANMKRMVSGLNLDLSTLRLQEHFVRFKQTLPGSGTLICRTRLRDIADTFDKQQSNIVVEGRISLS